MEIGPQMDDDTIIYIQTIQGNSIKTLVEGLKDVLIEINFEVDEDGIKVKALNPSQSVFVFLKLDASKFNTYVCKQKQIWSIYMPDFYKFLKTMGRDDVLTLTQNKNQTEKINIFIDNSEKSLQTKYSLNLYDINIESYDVPPQKFSSIITIPSQEFQKICRDMAVLSDKVEITSLKNLLTFYCKGDIGECTKTIGGSVIEQENGEIVHGKFSLNHLVQITKFTSLCNSIELKFKKKYPLVIKYTCAALGELTIALAPKVDDE
jgi:proliferating cell nuclear antigen